jgi:hypothetical protein
MADLTQEQLVFTIQCPAVAERVGEWMGHGPRYMSERTCRAVARRRAQRKAAKKSQRRNRRQR